MRITDNLHTMLSFSRRGGELEVRVHRMFLGAQPQIVDALAAYLRGGDPSASQQLDRFIQNHRRLIRRVAPRVRRRRLRLISRGRCHDLAAIFRQLNDRYFRGGIDCVVTWGPSPRAELPRKSIKLGSYSTEAQLIRIHPALDQPFVPRFFVEWILFHEMLHVVHRAVRRAGKRCVHTEAFFAAERRFPHFERARAWEREHLEKLLRWEPHASVQLASPVRSAEERG